MTRDLLDRLAEMEVPPPPAEFDVQLHQRVNRSIVTGQFIEMLVDGLPWAFLQFARAMIGAIVLTLTGRYERRK